MPTINKYADDSGYYIRARPSNVGNITYKIKEEGNPVVWRHGLRDGDEVVWSTIQSFKALGIIYTEESGTLGPDDFKPDPEQLEKTKLVESDARDLFEILTDQFELSREERAEIRSILGLPPELDFEAIGDQIEEYLVTYIDNNGLPIRHNRTAHSSESVEVSTWVEEKDSADYDTWRLHILFATAEEGESYFTDHCIHLCDEHGLEQWHIRVIETPSWDIKQVAIQQQAVILPQLLDELRTANFDPGDPSEMLAPTVDPTWGNNDKDT